MGDLADRIVGTLETGSPILAPLKTDQRVLARITEGIYRQPSSALRELISNAYDADATEVVILTDAPRFAKIIVRDNGKGLDPIVLEDLIEHIGASSKGSTTGIDIGVANPHDKNLSKGGRKLIGRMGIGLFSVAQLTRHFQIITKTKGANFRTIVDITLNIQADGNERIDFDAGQARVWTVSADDLDTQGTEILLLDLRKTTRDELASKERWDRLDAHRDDHDELIVIEPKYHTGRVYPTDPDSLKTIPNLPWKEGDDPRERFGKLVQSVFDEVGTTQSNPSLEVTFDKYLQLIWTLSLAAPLDYLDSHPFDLKPDGKLRFFELSNEPKGQAKEITLLQDQRVRDRLGYTSPNKIVGDNFSVYVDGVQLFRPIRFHDLPSTDNAIETPLLFTGHYEPDLSSLPESLSGGDLKFEAYLLWCPVVVPTQHRGVIVRIGNASGMAFDSYFMSYQVSEQTRLRQLTAEIFIHKGLEHAINIDRESFNFAHPHYQLIEKWLHSAIKQFANRQKAIGKELQQKRRDAAVGAQTEKLQVTVSQVLAKRGFSTPPEVVIVEDDATLDAAVHRKEGKIVLPRDVLTGHSNGGSRSTANKKGKAKIAEEKVKAVTQVLHSWGVLDGLTYADQEKLIQDLVEILTLDDNV